MRKFKKILLVLTLFFWINLISSCSTEIVSKIDPGDFNDYSNRLFGTIIGDDELTIHYLFKERGGEDRENLLSFFPLSQRDKKSLSEQLRSSV